MKSEAIKNGKQLTVKEKEKIAYRMRSSRKYLDESYLKIKGFLDIAHNFLEVSSRVVVHLQ